MLLRLGVLMCAVLSLSASALATTDASGAEAGAPEALVLEYTVEFDDYYTGGPADPPDHPLNLIRGVFEQWRKQHPDARMELVDIRLGGPESKRYSARVELWVTVDKAQQTALDAAVCAAVDVRDSRVISQAGYRWEKAQPYQDLRPDRLVVVNGVAVELAELTDEEHRRLEPWLNLRTEGFGAAYLAGMHISERFPLAQIVKLTLGGRGALVFRNHNEGLPAGVEVPLHAAPVMAYVGPVDLGEVYDPMDLVLDAIGPAIEYVSRTWKETDMNARGVTFRFAPPTEQHVPLLEYGVALFIQRYPAFARGGEVADALRVDRDEDGWMVTLWSGNSLLQQELRAEIERASTLQALRVPRSRSTLPETTANRRPIVPRIHNTSWNLLPQVYSRPGSPMDRIPTEARERAHVRYAAMRTTLEAWQAGNPDVQVESIELRLGDSPPESPAARRSYIDDNRAYIKVRATHRNGIPWHIQLETRELDPGVFEDLKARLNEATGKSKPDFAN